MTAAPADLRQWLIRATTGGFALKVISVGLGFFTTLLLARLLVPEQYGGYAYALAWVNLLVVPVVLGMDKLLIRQVSVFGQAERWGALHGIQRFSFGCVALLGGGTAAAWYAGVHLLEGYLDPVMIPPLQAAAFLVPIIALARLRAAVLTGLHQVVRGTFPEMVLRPALFMLLVAAGFGLLGWQPEGRSAVVLNLSAMVVSFLVGGGLLWRTVPGAVWRAAPEYAPRSWLAGALPLLLLATLQIVNARVDIIMLGSMRGAVDVAIYNVVSQGALLVSFVLVAASGALSPVVARLYAEGEKRRLQRLVTRGSRAILGASLPIGLLLMLFGEPFLGLFGEQYLPGYAALLVLVTGQLLNAAFGAVGVLLTMTSHGGLAARGAALGMIINIALNALLIPWYGIVGAAVASMLTLLLWNAVFAYFVHRSIGIRATVFG